MSLSDKLFNQIKQLSTNITEENYYTCHEQGYNILIKIKDLGIEQEQAFKLLLKYHNSLETAKKYCDNTNQREITAIK